MRYIALVMLSLLLAGCSSLSKQECRNADWYIIGLEDGSAGRTLQTVGSHRKACAKVDVVPDMAAYENGHDQGRRRYCTVGNGFQLGDSGARYNGVCQGLEEAAFVTAYDAGKFRHEVRTELNRLKSAISSRHERLDVIEDDISQIEHAIVSDRSTGESRRRDLATIKQLEAERSDIHATVQDYQDNLLILENELIDLMKDQRRAGYP